MKRKNKIITGMAAAVLALAAGSICAYADGGSGDIDGDGSITATDVVCAAAYVKGIRPLYGQALAAADVNGDGSVNAADVAMLAAHVKGVRSLNGNYSTPDPEPEPQGPVIEVRNGVTYVDGILIANKSYALPSNYGWGLTYSCNNDYGLTNETWNAFCEMQSAAWRDGYSLWVCSGYRSYDYQSSLYWGYVNRDGQWAADTYSARPGHSEHQTGLALDINYAESWFNNTAEAVWIANNCADYGFILRYPAGKEDKTGYKHESWHVRYVGKDLARKVTDSGLCLEEYLGIDSYYH